ncbi:MAG: exonuclease domain-containing protein, partial [Pseudomonadota bacterium]
MSDPTLSPAQLDALRRQLDASDDYRVVERYRRVDRYAATPEEAGAVKKGVFVDLETTGLDADTDRIIELALVPFEFSSDGRIYRVLE